MVGLPLTLDNCEDALKPSAPRCCSSISKNHKRETPVKVMKIARSTLVCAAVVVTISTIAAAQPQGDYGPPLETVKTFDKFKLVGVGVSHEGRIFASAPGAQSGDRLVEVNAQTGAVTPYPDQTWNTSGSDTEHEWVVPQAMWVDKADHLWVLDSGRAVMTGAGPSAKPKLVEFDLADNKVIRSFGFDGTVAPTDSSTHRPCPWVRVPDEHRKSGQPCRAGP